MIKESGADQDTIMRLMEESEVEVLDARVSSRYQPRKFS
jgi:hypothetical protein